MMEIEYIPTQMEFVELMLDMASVGPNDVVFDLGSGDGRIVINAAKRGAKSIGIETDTSLIDFAKRNAIEAGVDVEFRNEDMFDCNLTSATVVTVVVGHYAMDRIALKLCNLPKGTKIVSYGIKISWLKPKNIGFIKPINIYLYEM